MLPRPFPHMDGHKSDCWSRLCKSSPPALFAIGLPELRVAWLASNMSSYKSLSSPCMTVYGPERYIREAEGIVSFIRRGFRLGNACCEQTEHPN